MKCIKIIIEKNMNISELINNYSPNNYHDELIKMLAISVNEITFFLYILISFTFLTILEPFVPFELLLSWFLANFFSLGLRFYLGKKIELAINNNDTINKNKYLKNYIHTASLSGFLWGITAFFPFFYAPDVYLFLTLAILIGFSSGAVVTLGSIFHAYAHYLVLAMAPIFTLLLISGEILYVGTAFGVLMYFSIVLTGAYKYFTYLKTTIILKDELKEMNHSLKGEVVETLHELQTRHYYDNNTGLLNRYKLLEVFKEQHSSSFLLVDIIKFKNINDLYGIQIADELLHNFSTYLLKELNSKIFELYRFSGNEFIILNISKEYHDLGSLAYQLSEQINHVNFALNNNEFTVQIGVTIAIVNSEIDSKLSKANMALNYAKDHKQPWIAYSKDLHLEDHYKNDTKWTKIIKDAIDNDNVIPVFQPIIDREGVKKYECLMRIKHEGKIVTPYYFLDIAKKTHYYHDMTKIMIEKSFKVFQNRENSFSVNVSFEDISNPEVIHFLMQKIDEYKIENQLIIEIVESESIDNFDTVHHLINSLKERGVKIAIDDFGSGYSNFSYLLKLEPDFIKIDGSLIENIDTDMKAYIIVDVITNFSNRIGIEVIAEYVHSEAVYKKLIDLHIDYFQGYYFYEPLLEEELD